MRGQGFGVVVVGLVLLISGCVALPPSSPNRTQSMSVQTLRTDPDHRGLVASYTGGSCDVAARLAVGESDTRISVTIEVESSGGICDAAGHLRTVRARLDRPVGSRTIHSGEWTLVPFDGTRLRVPSAGLPDPFSKTSEWGENADPAPGGGGSYVTTGWTTTYSEPRPPNAGDTCTPTRTPVEIRLGPASQAQLSSDWTPVSTTTIAGVPAHLYRETVPNLADGLAYTWTVNRTAVAVVSQPACAGDTPLTEPELLRVANSLRPA